MEGASSGVAVSADNDSVKRQFRRSNPYSLMVPLVRIGLGRTNASAARKPGLSVSSDAGCDTGVIDGCGIALFRFPGETWLAELL